MKLERCQQYEEFSALLKELRNHIGKLFLCAETQPTF